MTFAYMAFSCDWSPSFEKEFADWYHGDMIEAFMEAEDDSPNDSMCFGWESMMSRIAVVQLTQAWDPRPVLEGLILRQGKDMRYRKGYYREQNNIILTEPLEEVADDSLDFPMSAKVDVTRFCSVINTTSQLAKRENRDLLFICGEGWGYDMETPRRAQKILSSQGMTFVTRHA